MSKMIKIQLILLVFLSVTLSSSSKLEWKDKTSNKIFNYDSLKKRNNWKVIDNNDNGFFSMEYDFSFGENKVNCNGKYYSVIEALDIFDTPTDTCESLGVSDDVTHELIDGNEPGKGFVIIYGNGEKCITFDEVDGNLKPRRTKFIIECGLNEDENVGFYKFILFITYFPYYFQFIINFPGQTQGETKCTMEFKIKSPAGCPIEVKANATSNVFFNLFILFLIYLIVRIVINIKIYNLKGIDSIPHYSIIVQVCVSMQYGIEIMIDYIKNFVYSNSKANSKEIEEYNPL